MNTKFTVENSDTGALLCTLDIPDLGSRQALTITMQLPKEPGRTLSQMEYQLLTKAHELLGQMRSRHRESKDGSPHQT